jgi:hypothetical protein
MEAAAAIRPLLLALAQPSEVEWLGVMRHSLAKGLCLLLLMMCQLQLSPVPAAAAAVAAVSSG